jgi:predicted permease
MFVRLFSIISPILICAAIGYAWARLGRPFDTRFVTRLIMNVGAPFLIISSLAKTTVDKAALAEVGMAVVCVLVLTGVAGMVLLRMFRLEVRSYLNALVFPNTGNMGLPLCLFAFGAQGLSLALVVFVLVSTAHFTAGIAILSGRNDPRQFLTSPIVWSTVAGLALLWTGWELPAFARNTLDIMAGLTIPLMLLALGVSIANIKVSAFGRSLLIALMRLGIGLGVGVLVASVFGLTGAARGVVILDAAMPVAVFNYLLAERYDRAPDEVAGAVVVSTLISFVTLPILLYFLLSG